VLTSGRAPAGDGTAGVSKASTNVVVDARETQRRGPSYTVDTLTELQAESPVRSCS
jgi:nicotinic acid mononucleotide adenylyltransferase